MSTQPISVFLSHHSADKPAIRQLATALTRRGLLPWLDEDRLSLGVDIDQQLTQAIRAGVVTVVLLTPDSLASGWVDQELRLAMELEARSDPPRRCILPLFDRLTPDDLRGDPRFHPWFKGGRLNRLYVLASEGADVVADRITQAVGELQGLGAATELKLVCDSRGTGVMVGAPEAVAPTDLPTLVFRPHRGDRTFDLTLVDDAWDAWRADMARGLRLLLGSHRPGRGVRLQLRCQMAVGCWLGAQLDRQVAVPVSVYEPGGSWRLASGHQPGKAPSAPLPVLSDVRGDTTTVLIWDGSPTHRSRRDALAWHHLHGDGPLLALSYAAYLGAGHRLDPTFDLPTWANQAVADLTQDHPRHLRLILAGPIWMGVALGHLLTRIEVPALSVLEWDATAGRYGSCRIR